MNTLTKTTLLLSLFIVSILKAQTYHLKPFNEVVVSPHISVTFVKGLEEKIEVKMLKVDKSKLNLEQSKDELHIYLEDAKTTTKQKKVTYDDYSGKKPVYQGTIAELVVTYTSLEDLSLRGGENFLIKNKVEASDFNLAIYGASKVVFNEVAFDESKTTIYGESELTVKKGHIGYQKITSYGESEIDLLGVRMESVKVVAYGEAKVRLNVSDALKVTSFGEATVAYKGNPEVSKGFVIGDADIYRITD